MPKTQPFNDWLIIYDELFDEFVMFYNNNGIEMFTVYYPHEDRWYEMPATFAKVGTTLMLSETDTIIHEE